MSPAVLMERAAVGRPADIADAEAAAPTLDSVFAATWSELRSDRATDCPVCGETMGPVYAAHARPVGGRCASCGTELR